jgi:hypothetical protein
LFDESINAIIDAFDQQRKVATIKITVSYTLCDWIVKLNRNSQMAFLVGGMGTNDFVWTRLQSHFRAQGINICRPDNDMYALL